MAELFKPGAIKGARDWRAARGMVRFNLMNSDEWLVRGLECLFHRQTLDEKSDQSTKYKNRRGFNSADSPLLTSFAVQLVERRRRDVPGVPWLTKRQLDRMRPMMLKYAGQLARVARGEDEQRSG